MTTTLERERERQRYFTTLTPDQAGEIYRRHMAGERTCDLAVEYGISRNTIYAIRYKRLWVSLTNAIDAEQLVAEH